jgi:MFS family permease
LRVLAWLPALVVAAVLLGAAYGPAPPAGSRILAATAPPRHRSLIFSIGQSGGTLGAVVAGLVAPPLALAFGWEAVCLLGLAATLATAFAVQPWRATLTPSGTLSVRSVRARCSRPATSRRHSSRCVSTRC